MELQQLKYFAQVAQMESISKAAESLHVSQPAVSRSIIRLEEELGTQLFDRIGKRVCLNDVGVLFLGSVEKALQDLNQAASLASSANRGVEGSLGVVAFGPQRDAIGCVVSFMKGNPSVRMTFNARQRSSNPQIVRDFDLVFYPEGPSFASISGIPYARTRTLLCVPADHPLAHRGTVDLSAFKDDEFIFANTTAGVYDRCHRLCVESGFAPRVRAVTSSGVAQLEFVRAGLGVCLVDMALGPRGTTPQGEGVSYLNLSGGLPDQVLYLACRPVQLLSPPARRLLSHALGHFGIPADERTLARFDAN